MAFIVKNKVQLTNEQSKRILQFAFMDDLDFYEEFTMCLPDEEQKKFFEDNPDFMSEFTSGHERYYLLKDKMYRNILRKIKKCEEH